MLYAHRPQEVNWIPSNSVAGTLIDAAFFEDGLAPSHNIVHPRPVKWARMIEDVQHSLKSQLGRDVPIIPFQEWFEKLEATAARADVDVQEVVSRPSCVSIFELSDSA